MRPYPAPTAHEDIFGEGLLEALMQTESGWLATLFLACDVEARGPLATMA
jgi:hypothetical protein